MVSRSENEVRIAGNLKYTVIDGTAIVMNLKTGKYLGLNEVGTRIFELLHKHCSPEKVVERLLDEYDVEEDALRADVQRTLRDFERHGLIEDRD